MCVGLFISLIVLQSCSFSYIVKKECILCHLTAVQAFVCLCSNRFFSVLN